MKKRSTKFFIAAVLVNMILSAISVFSTLLKEVRLVDVVTFYATAFGAGASFAGMIVSLRNAKKNIETHKEN